MHPYTHIHTSAIDVADVVWGLSICSMCAPLRGCSSSRAPWQHRISAYIPPSSFRRHSDGQTSSLDPTASCPTRRPLDIHIVSPAAASLDSTLRLEQVYEMHVDPREKQDGHGVGEDQRVQKRLSHRVPVQGCEGRCYHRYKDLRASAVTGTRV